MPFVDAKGIQLHYVEHGQGDHVVLYVHGNLGCVDWMNLVWPHLPKDLRVIAIDWRGCGLSDKPALEAAYANYSMPQHAEDMIHALDALGIGSCGLCGHSTGGIIALYMLDKQPARFTRFLGLDPIGPMGIALAEDKVALFSQMKADREFTFRVLATAAASLFDVATLGTERPAFAPGTSDEQKALYEHLVDMTRLLSDGIWFGTPHNLAHEHEDGMLRARQKQIAHPTKILWGELDFWIPREHMEEMAEQMPNCSLEIIPGVGHSMNVEQPAEFARRFTAFFQPANGGSSV
ncbi:MAG: Haloalkane dehalogenase [Betaproteobacteria bacterium ADurb.Bin341]|nr:MAG: Haloalkane dehalogenase [Betaproteobacteria bacterium ADurb.Bin341]